jgi:hypothetical protein
MWTESPTVLDEPVKILGLEVEGFSVVGMTLLFAGCVFDTLPSFLCAAGVGVAFYYAKRGKPPGIIPHQLHRLELAKLPGVLSPRRRSYSPW